MKWLKVKKRPITVRARLFDGNPNDPDIKAVAILNDRTHSGFIIETLNGPVQIKSGDWIIKGIKGDLDLYPCRNDVFKETYDFVN